MDNSVLPTGTNSVDCEEDEAENKISLGDDPIFQQIKTQIERRNERKNSLSTVTTESQGDGSDLGFKTSDNFMAIAYGFQPRASYEHSKKQTDIMGIVFNDRMHKFVILDSKGVTTWCKDAIDQTVIRTLTYPRYEYRVINNIVYAKKYNVYFCLGKEFSLRVLNRDFEEVCNVTSGIRSILFMLFNPIRDELITGGVGGSKVWAYQQVAQKTFTEIKPMANYKLLLKYELPNVGGSWVKRVELDLNLQHLYCCSDTDLYAYDLDGNEIYRFERAHEMTITGCAFSQHARLLVTASVDTDVKAWSLAGGLVHTFRGHSRPVTNLMLHPDTSSLVLTSSLDGSVRIWSLDTMELFYSFIASTEGVLWMGLTNEKLLYLGTMRNLTMWSLNQVTSFWAQSRNKVVSLSLVSGEGKSTRVMAVGEDSCVRIFSRKEHKNLSTVLPPPSLSPMENIKSVAYNRLVNAVYLLIDHKDIWVYTARTDPASRIAVWDALQIQQELNLDMNASRDESENKTSNQRASSSLLKDKGPVHRATENGSGNESISACFCLCYLNSTAMLWTDEGMACPLVQHYLLWGLEDGRILFMDPVIRRLKHFEFRANKDSIRNIVHDQSSNSLLTRCCPGDYSLIQVWSLPGLELQCELFCPADVTGMLRMGMSVITAHASGSVIHHTLVSTLDGHNGGKHRYEGYEAVPEHKKKEHNGAVIAIDACQNLGIFVTCSADGAIKVWEENKTLLTEITLDDTLTSAAFLNNRGDLLVGFRNHIFVIDHNKVCPSVEVPSEKEEEFETESVVYEDPAVMYEGVLGNPDPIDLDTYLVPFDIDFSTDFLEGRRSVSPVKSELLEEVLEEDAMSEVSAAPTDMYESPFDTPRRLSLVDLTLSREVTKHDLRKQMRDMLEGRNAYREDMSTFDHDVRQYDPRSIELPQFGISPGPSPTPSTPSSISTPESMAVSEGGVSSPEPEVHVNEVFKPIEIAETTPAKKVEAPKAVKKELVKEETVKPPPPPPSRFANFKIDPTDLMKPRNVSSAKQVAVPIPRKEADHAHVRGEEAEPPRAKPSRPMKKKERKSAKERKMPKKGEKKKASAKEEEVASYVSKDEGETVSKPAAVKRAQPVAESSSSSEDDGEEPTRPKRRGIPTSNLDMKARTFGASATAGATSKPKKKDKKYMMSMELDPQGTPMLGPSPTPQGEMTGEELGAPDKMDTIMSQMEVDKDYAAAQLLEEAAKSHSSSTTQGIASARKNKLAKKSRERKRVGAKGPPNIPDTEPQAKVAIPVIEILDSPRITKDDFLKGYHVNELDKDEDFSQSEYDHLDDAEALRPRSPVNGNSVDKSGIADALTQFNSRPIDYISMYTGNSVKENISNEGTESTSKNQLYKYNTKSDKQITIASEEVANEQDNEDPETQLEPETEGSRKLSLHDIAAKNPNLLQLGNSHQGRSSRASSRANSRANSRTNSPRHSRATSPAQGRKNRSSSPHSSQGHCLDPVAVATKLTSISAKQDLDMGLGSTLDAKVTAITDIPSIKQSRITSAKSILKPFNINDLSRGGTPSSQRVAFHEVGDEEDAVLLGRLSVGGRRSVSPNARSPTPYSDMSSGDERESPVQEIMKRLGSAQIGSARHRLALEIAALNGEIPPEYHPDYSPQDGEDGGQSSPSSSSRERSAGSRNRSAGSRIKSAGGRTKSPYDSLNLPKSGADRGVSPSMTIYSDHGSEWTVPPPEDYDLARLDEIMEEERMMREMRDTWTKGVQQARPQTAIIAQARPNTPSDGVIRAWRPYTAHDFPSKTEELKIHFEDALKKFKGLPGTPDYVDKLYRKDGTHFDQSYHEKLIERHLLLRMQKQLRAQTANDNRQLLQLRQQQRRKALLGHGECDAPASKTKSDATLHMLQHLRQRAATAGASPVGESRANQKTPAGYRSAGASVMGYSRAKTATPGSRPTSAVTKMSAFSRPGTAMYPESVLTTADKADLGSERPFSSPPNTPEHEPPILDPSESYQILQSLYSCTSSWDKETISSIIKQTSNDPLPHQPATSGVKMVSCTSPRLAKRGLKKRIRIAREPPKTPSFNKTTDEDVKNAKLMDPRNPQSRLFKHPSKSIPSKCSRYILITHPKPSNQQVEPTPLEQQLIENRFPEWKDRWLAGKLQTPRQKFLSEIVPFKDYEPTPVLH